MRKKKKTTHSTVGELKYGEFPFFGGVPSADAAEIRRLRDALKEIAQLEAHYAETPRAVALARAALGCRRNDTVAPCS